MISTIDGGHELLVETDAHRLDEDLNTADKAAIPYATKEGRHGILVTRHGHTTFTVAVSGKVPLRADLGGNRPAVALPAPLRPVFFWNPRWACARVAQPRRSSGSRHPMRPLAC